MTARERAREIVNVMRGTIAEIYNDGAISIEVSNSLFLTCDFLDNAIDTALADAERSGMLKVMDEGSLWSFMRSVLSQGGAIQQDYQSGKYNDYEGYSARLDCAARERADQWIAQAIRAQADRKEG